MAMMAQTIISACAILGSARYHGAFLCTLCAFLVIVNFFNLYGNPYFSVFYLIFFSFGKSRVNGHRFCVVVFKHKNN